MVGNETQFEIEIRIDENCLFVSANGKYSLTKAINLFKYAIDNSVLQNKGRVIIDVRGVAGQIPFIDRYDYSKFLAEYIRTNGIIKMHRIAVVGHEPIVHRDRFGEVVTRNRGANVRVFTDMQEASIWINEE